MVFSSTVFLFLFLPVVLALYFGARVELRNLILLVASLLFYSWGEAPWVMVASIGINYVFGLWIERLGQGRTAQAALALCVVVNLALIAAFKYSNFLVENLNAVLGPLGLGPVEVGRVRLPLGISFFTFHAMSYVVDIYRRQARAMRNPFDMALYISFFPQLVAGPIIRFHEIADQFRHRTVTAEGFATGVRRFVIGLAKKMLIANTVAVAADGAFSTPAGELTVGLAWLGIVCYTLQIYFDFSGYSDMAIGLGRMFGFVFPENFDYPYASTSITAFWRRWHMTLSNWFRDYLYIPLGGNRHGPVRTYANLLTVFVLCGLWHGASWTFIAWGLYHGAFLVVERVWARSFGRRAGPAGGDVQPGEPAGAVRESHGGPLAAPVRRRRLAVDASVLRPVAYAYTILAVMVGWVLFRADSFSHAMAVLRAMAGTAPGTGVEFNAQTYLTNELVLVIAAGVVGSLPWVRWLARFGGGDDATAVAGAVAGAARPVTAAVLACGGFVFLVVAFLASAAKLAAGTHNPFIYFRF